MVSLVVVINRWKHKSNIGDTIKFKRQVREHFGIVLKVNENSVIVEINSESQQFLDYPNNRTVVGHRNYVVVDSKQVV